MSTIRPTRLVLEDALAADPDELAAHAAYADLLAEEGDPRGEYLQFTLAGEDADRPAPERRALEAQALELFRRHQRAWLGPLAPFLLDGGRPDDPAAEPDGTFGLRRGWIDTLTVNRLTPEFAAALADAPQLRLLRELTIFGPTRPGRQTAAAWAPLHAATVLGNVRLLRLGTDASPWPDHLPDGRGVVGLISRLPMVEHLDLSTMRLPLDRLYALPMPRLQTLRVWQPDHQPNPLAALAANPTLTRLERIESSTTSVTVISDRIDPEAVRALVFLARKPALNWSSLLH
jgi:uncharacterized protein (TIGR02996 family)